MSNDFYAKGTIKVKNQDGALEPFHPRTDFSSVEDAEGTTLTQIVSNISTQITEAENSGGIELMFEEPTSENTADFSNETMIAWIDYPDVWQYVVDTRVHVNQNGWSEPNNTKTAIPFNLYGMPGITLTVDWGDGSTSTLTSSDYEESDSRASEHEYAEKGIYTVRVKSSDWSNTHFSTYQYARVSYTASTDKFNFLIYFRGTLVQIESAIPGIKGTKCWLATNQSRTTYENSLRHMFKECVNLQYVVPSLFKNCSNITDFQDCFNGCQKLLAIPKDLFKHNVNASNFAGCFFAGYALTSIPEELFKYNVAATNFSECFSWCNIVREIPENLFRYNTEATDFSECFGTCASVHSIPENLFRYNVKATDFSECFKGTGVTSLPEDLFRYNAMAIYFKNCFQDSSLTSIPENLFRYNTNAVSFEWCFSSCNSLSSIPENLFRYNTNAVDFTLCFAWCHSLTSLPSDLFRYNTSATDFGGCFSRCDKLTALPSDLFRYNTSATDFGGCFEECSALNGIEIHIGSTSVSDCSNFVAFKSGTTRTIYVPSGSTTEATFNAIASDLGLTIIGE